jgi:NAD(P)-dependent dehydrogenase (short-subunit alcohol dehydrogenase family)
MLVTGRGRGIGRAIARRERLDGVVNNAAVADPHAGPIEGLSLARWRRALDVNLTGAFLVVEHRSLRAAGGAARDRQPGLRHRPEPWSPMAG